MFRLVASMALCACLGAAPFQGRVTDGQRGLVGVRVYPDRPRQPLRSGRVPWALTDAEGRFRLELAADDAVLAVEKDGWMRDLAPLAVWKRDLVLRPAPGFHRERVLAVRLAVPDRPAVRSDEDLRRLFFSRIPGEASVASYLYEASKGTLQLEEGALFTLPGEPTPLPRDEHSPALVRRVLERLRGQDLRDFDRVDNRTGEPLPDGKPDHLWIIPPGGARNVSLDPADLTAICYRMPLPWDASRIWDVVLFPERTPLGNIIHEALHAMGEHRVDDFYLDCAHPDTAGIWDPMDVGQYRGWTGGRGLDEIGTSPSQPMGWVRSELWYRGRFRDTVKTLELRSLHWQGWLDPLERAPGVDPQRLVVPDPRKRGRFWELSVRRPWGFDGGRMVNRWGPGFEGLVVARVDPALLSEGVPKGPVRVVDAHPRTPEPPAPRLPCRRWELDDAAYNLGPGENPVGQDGPLRWEVLETDAAGRMKVRLGARRGKR